jgi:drug/metabolite transporter (DMT)-like permease
LTLSVIWIPAALMGGLFQAWRTALQQRLRADLTVSGASLVRYLYGAPVGICLWQSYLALNADRLSPVGWHDLTWIYFSGAACAGLFQIIGTNLLIMAFGGQNFVVGTAFSKTEAVQAALFGWLVLSEHLQILTWLGIGLGVSGVLTLALGGQKIQLRLLPSLLTQRSALCGLGAGGFFAMTSVMVKTAVNETPINDPIATGLMILSTVNVLQVIMQGAYITAREPGTWLKVFITWRTSSIVGILAACGSACWFTGFAAAPVALVRIVGQVEVIFTLAFARLYLREQVKRHEVVGLFAVTGGVILALLGAWLNTH